MKINGYYFLSLGVNLTRNFQLNRRWENILNNTSKNLFKKWISKGTESLVK